jgi:hypothetical protein
MGTCAATTTAGSPRPGRLRLLGAALGAALVLAGVTGVTGRGEHPAGPRRAAPAAAHPAGAAVGSPERAPRPLEASAGGGAFEIIRAEPALEPAPACSVRRAADAGGAAPDALRVPREDLVAVLVDVCGAGWAFAPAAAGAPPAADP